MKIILATTFLVISIAFGLKATAAPLGYTLVDGEGFLECQNCLLDLITGLNVYETTFDKPKGDGVNYYVFWSHGLASGTEIHIDPMLPGNYIPRAPPRISEVPIPESGLLMGCALVGLMGLSRARR